MLRTFVGLVIVLSIAAAAAYTASPQVRVRVDAAISDWRGWTPEARQRDPLGFVRHAAARLESDINRMVEVRGELLGQIGEVAAKLRQQRALQAQAARLAEQFRQQYQQAARNGNFPVTTHNGAYSEDRIVAQVSMLLAETEGYRRNAEELERVLQTAERQLEVLTVRIAQSEAQLTTLRVKEPLLRAKLLAVEGAELAARVDELLEGNRALIAANPVRSVRELLAAEAPADRPEYPAREMVLAFLASPSPGDALPESDPQSGPTAEPDASAPADAVPTLAEQVFPYRLGYGRSNTHHDGPDLELQEQLGETTGQSEPATMEGSVAGLSDHEPVVRSEESNGESTENSDTRPLEQVPGEQPAVEVANQPEVPAESSSRAHPGNAEGAGQSAEHSECTEAGNSPGSADAAVPRATQQPKKRDRKNTGPKSQPVGFSSPVPKRQSNSIFRQH